MLTVQAFIVLSVVELETDSLAEAVAKLRSLNLEADDETRLPSSDDHLLFWTMVLTSV